MQDRKGGSEPRRAPPRNSPRLAAVAVGLAALTLAASDPTHARGPAPAAARPATEAAVKGYFDPKTKIVEGPALQVVFGERAVFHLNENGEPVLDRVEKGKLAVAHPPGAAKESFTKPAAGKLAVALDGSAEKKASYLKIWNGLDYPVAYRAGVLVLVKGKLAPFAAKVCAVPAGGTTYETWPRPVVAVAVASFAKAKDDKTCK